MFIVQEYSKDLHGVVISGTADTNSDTSPVFDCGINKKTFFFILTRPTSGNAGVTIRASINGVNFIDYASLTIASGTSATAAVVDKPVRFLQVVFTDVGSAVCTLQIQGV